MVNLVVYTEGNENLQLLNQARSEKNVFKYKFKGMAGIYSDICLSSRYMLEHP